MVKTPNYDLDIDSTLGGSNASDYIIPSQKAIKDYVDNHGGGGGSVSIDNKSITTNSSDEFQTVGVINQNAPTTAVKTWTGTKAQYDAIVTKDANTLYNITDDSNVTDIRALGQIVQSTIPLVDAGLHLLDGSVIAYGSYKAFVDYIAGLVTDYPDLFTTEANWQQAVTNYGVCGKFVYDSVGKTIRLPKITGFTEGTTDVTALGDLTEAGLPNITGEYRNNCGDGPNNTSGAIFVNNSRNNAWWSGATNVQRYNQINFDASRSNPIYGNSTTVQPQSIKVLYYIVIATLAKTDIEVDIDEIATDLNGKADTDLSNMNPTQTVKNTIVGWGMPDWSNAVAISQSTMLSGYTCPFDGIVCGRYNPTNANSYIKVNDVWVSGGDNEITPLFSLVNKNDVVTAGSMDSTYWNISFVPFKGVN